MKKEFVIIADNLSKEFRIGFKKHQGALARILGLFSGKESKKKLVAIDNVSLKVKAGEIVGVIGSNGSGKSTLLRILADIYPVYSGEVKTRGKVVPIIGLGAGMHDRLTMKENIFLLGSLFGLGQSTIKRRFSSIVEFANLENFVNTKLYQFSTGMLERLAFSIAIHSDPDILLLDEVFEVGDEAFKKKSADKIKELVRNGASVLLVSHELWMVEKYCNRVIWLKKGKIVKQGDAKKIIKEYVKNKK